MDFSADVLQSSRVILKKYPTITFFNTIIFVVQSGLSSLFTCGAVLVYCLEINYWIYVYVIFSYFWIQCTLTYVVSQTCAGVAVAWYFLNDTEYMPTHPILFSLGHTLTTGLTCGFGSCCFCCFKCCCQCALCIIDKLIGLVSRYSLIYCSMFGVPASEGVKRWGEVSERKVVDMVVNSTIIDQTFRFYSYVACAACGGIGGLIGNALWDKSDARFAFIFSCSGTCAAFGLILIGNPLKVISDALFVGFAEAPQRMETGAHEIYELFSGKAKELIDEEIDRAKHPEKYANERKCCWFLSWLPCFS
jgi:hypothetical protein